MANSSLFPPGKNLARKPIDLSFPYTFAHQKTFKWIFSFVIVPIYRSYNFLWFPLKSLADGVIVRAPSLKTAFLETKKLHVHNVDFLTLFSANAMGVGLQHVWNPSGTSFVNVWWHYSWLKKKAELLHLIYTPHRFAVPSVKIYPSVYLSILFHLF